MQHQRIPQQGPVPRINSDGLSFARDDERFSFFLPALAQRLYPAFSVHRLFKQIIFVTAEASYILAFMLPHQFVGADGKNGK